MNNICFSVLTNQNDADIIIKNFKEQQAMIYNYFVKMNQQQSESYFGGGLSLLCL